MGLPLGGEDGDQEGGGGKSCHFTYECKGKRYNQQSLPQEGSPPWVPAVWSPDTMDYSRFYLGKVANTSRGQSSGKQTNNLVATQIVLSRFSVEYILLRGDVW